ncbi:N2227-like protein-domain-containing protein [Aspergillus varians]
MQGLWVLLLACIAAAAKVVEGAGSAGADWQDITQVIVANITILEEPNVRQEEEFSRLQHRLQRSTGTWNPSHPRHRLLMALYGFSRYKERNLAEVTRWRDLYKHVPKSQKQRVEKVVGYSRKLNTVEHLFDDNHRIARDIVRHGLEFYDIEQNELDEFIKAVEKEKKNPDRTSVVQAMKHFVRDWSEEGLFEREDAFKCILDNLASMDRSEERPIRVLAPGAGAGRLGYEIDTLGGFEVTINEWSAYMNLVHRYATQVSTPNSLDYYPYIDWWSHQATTSDMQRAVHFPDWVPSTSRVVMVEGDFTSLFPESESGTYDVIVSLFFIDTARNLMSYLENIHRLLKPGGTWINLGPLLYGTGPWLQLSLDEIVKVSEALGFEFHIDGPESDVCGTPTPGEGLDGKARSLYVPYAQNSKGLSRNAMLEEDSAAVHSLLRRIDWRILPIMFLTYFLQFLDKVCLNVRFLLQKYPITRVLGCNVLVWGIALCCSTAAQNYAGLLALRIILGIAEAVVAPALTMYTSMWYTRRASTPRFGLWYCGLGVGQIIGGLVSFGAQHASPSLSLTGWRIMFLVIGLVNILAALLILTLLPLSPDSAPFLSATEKAHLAYRLQSDSAGLGRKRFYAPSLVTTLTDAQTWLLLLLTILTTMPSGLITTFSSSLIRGFGYTSKQSALLNTPSGVTVAPLSLILAWIGANFKGYTGKVAGSAFISAGFSVANIIGPQTFQARDAPEYIPAKVTIVAVNAAGIAVSCALRVLYGARNKKAERLGGSARSSMEKRIAKGEEMDMYPGFRYVY